MSDLKPKTRIRSSQATIEKAISAAQSCGLTVDKLLINGGRVELRLAPVDAQAQKTNPAGPKKWPKQS